MTEINSRHVGILWVSSENLQSNKENKDTKHVKLLIIYRRECVDTQTQLHPSQRLKKVMHLQIKQKKQTF